MAGHFRSRDGSTEVSLNLCSRPLLLPDPALSLLAAPPPPRTHRCTYRHEPPSTPTYLACSWRDGRGHRRETDWEAGGPSSPRRGSCLVPVFSGVHAAWDYPLPHTTFSSCNSVVFSLPDPTLRQTASLSPGAEVQRPGTAGSHLSARTSSPVPIPTFLSPPRRPDAQPAASTSLPLPTRP